MPQKSTILQIATPYLIGTGFCLTEDGLVVTNEHIVRDSSSVVVDHPALGRQEGKVVYLDAKRDLALVKIEQTAIFSTIELQSDLNVEVGQRVFASGGLVGGMLHTISGEIIELDFEVDGISYIRHSAVMQASDNGSPLLNDAGVLLGVNTFIRRNGEMVALCLPVDFIKEALADFKYGKGKTACRCFNCGTTVYEDSQHDNSCPNCREDIQLPNLIPAFEPVGVAATIENLLSETVEEIALSRKGPNYWEVQQGSAMIHITYYEKNGLIVGDAYLCTLPTQENEALFAYLLKQNYEIENLTFSIRNGDIVLSLMIYDRYLNETTGRDLFQYLFKQADDFDNILVEQYGAIWKKP